MYQCSTLCSNKYFPTSYKHISKPDIVLTVSLGQTGSFIINLTGIKGNTYVQNPTTMANVVLTVKRVIVGVDFYTVVFNEEFDGMVQLDDNQFAEAKIDSISFNSSYVHQSVINLLPGVDLLYTAKKQEGKSFATSVMALLKDAKMTIKRDKFAAGDTYVTDDGEELEHQHDGYSRDILDIEVSTRVQKQLDRILDDALAI